MAGPRRAQYVSIPLAPGVMSNTSPRGAKTRVNYMTWDRWKDCNWVRWHKGLSEKIGGWAYIALTSAAGVAGALYLGIARALFDWSSLDGQFWIAIGTHLKLYVVNNQVLSDITPSRKSSNLTNALALTTSSFVVTVTDPGHEANTGDYIALQGTGVSGDFASLTTLDGQYPITVIDQNTYTFLASAPATGNHATVGGAFTITYDISAGLANNGQLLGYGTGLYGAGTYGTPRASGTGVFARLRSWSLFNYGQDLIASYSDGEIYWWQKNLGSNTRAGLLANAPTNVQRVIVDSQNQFVIALGCTDVTGAYNAMMVRWCNEGDIETWFPGLTVSAGVFTLTGGSRLVTGIQSKSQNLLWTDTHLFRMVLGGPNVYNFINAGGCKIVGPNAAIDVDGVAYCFGFDNFYTYDGTLSILECEVWETVFDNNNPNSPGFMRSQAEKVQTFTNEGKTEVTWLYPSNTGNGEIDRYVTYNWDDGVWYYGALVRTAMRDASPAITGAVTNPYGVNGGYLYEHEVGTDAVEASGTTALGYFLESLDMTTGGAKSEFTIGGSDARFAVGGSDAGILINSMLPDFVYLNGSMNLYIKTKDRPQDANYAVSSKSFSAADTQVDIRAQGSQIAIRLDNITSNAGGDPNFANVVLLLHMDGAPASTSFPDSSSAANTVTAHGSAAVSATQVEFGTGAMHCPGNATAAYLQMPMAANGPLDIFQGDFTIECWAYSDAPGSNEQNIIIDYGDIAATGGIRLYYNTTSGVSTVEIQPFGGAYSGWNFISSPALSLGVYHALAVCRQGSTGYLFVDGVLVGTANNWVNHTTIGTSVFIGASSNSGGQSTYMRGYIDEVRVTKGVARYTVGYTPSLIALPNSGNLPSPGLGSSFRMGIWQALATPYGHR